MAYRSRLEQACQEINDAQESAEKAMLAHQRGASCDVVVSADRKLADAHARYYEVASGRVRDDR